MKASGGSLVIRAASPACQLLVNDKETNGSPLRHGDVVVIGATRFFIQQSGTASSAETAQFHGKKTAMKIIGATLLAIAVITVLVRGCHQPEPEPVAPPIRHFSSSLTNDPALNDFVVTNVPRIQIDPSIIVTSRPPEVVEATILMDSLRTNTYPDPKASRFELDHAALFLQKAGDMNLFTNPVRSAQDAAELKAAQGLFPTLTAPLASAPVITNAVSGKPSTNTPAQAP